MNLDEEPIVYTVCKKKEHPVLRCDNILRQWKIEEVSRANVCNRMRFFR